MSLLERERDTICAIATPSGPGGIGIVRISGPESLSILKSIFRPKAKVEAFESHRMYYGKIIDPLHDHEVLDECMAVYMKAPRSYTREDVVELQSHSGYAVLKRILDLVNQHGARLALPGEFTKRAFLNGRIDLSQAEALMELIEAQTEDERRLAITGLLGTGKGELERLRDALLFVLSHLEVAIDFPDEDVEIVDEVALEKRLRLEVLQPIEELLARFEKGRIFREGARVVFAGRPNVGKSSIFNAILGMGRVIVSPVPGTTRDTIEETVDIEGLRVVLVDTAGIRERPSLRGGEKEKSGARGSAIEDIEALGIELSLKELRRASLVLVVLDLSDGLLPEDIDLFSHLPEETPFIVIFNKIDLVPSWKERVEEFEGVLREKSPMYHKKRASIPVSAKERTGLDELKRTIFKTIVGEDAMDVLRQHAFIPNQRQKECLKRALTSSQAAIEGLSTNRPMEIVAMDVREAICALDEITGRGVQGDLLDKIFSTFCLGK